MWFEIYETQVGREFPTFGAFKFEWRWRLRARNGRIVADGAEGYATKGGVRKAINRLTTAMLQTGARLPIREVES